MMEMEVNNWSLLLFRVLISWLLCLFPACSSQSVQVVSFAGTGSPSFADGQGTSASFKYPAGLAFDAAGNLYVADSNNHRIRKVTSGGGYVTTLAGSGAPAFADGQGTNAKFFSPFSVAVDGNGNVYVADIDNVRIRKITSAGLVSTLAGSGVRTFADGFGTGASFNNPSGVAVDQSGNVYVADSDNHRIRKITRVGVVTTWAGSGTPALVNGAGTSACFYNPYGIFVDVNGSVYVGDSSNHKIRKIISCTISETYDSVLQVCTPATGAGQAVITSTVTQIFNPVVFQQLHQL